MKSSSSISSLTPPVTSQSKGAKGAKSVGSTCGGASVLVRSKNKPTHCYKVCNITSDHGMDIKTATLAAGTRPLTRIWNAPNRNKNYNIQLPVTSNKSWQYQALFKEQNKNKNRIKTVGHIKHTRTIVFIALLKESFAFESVAMSAKHSFQMDMNEPQSLLHCSVGTHSSLSSAVATFAQVRNHVLQKNDITFWAHLGLITCSICCANTSIVQSGLSWFSRSPK